MLLSCDDRLESRRRPDPNSVGGDNDPVFPDDLHTAAEGHQIFTHDLHVWGDRRVSDLDQPAATGNGPQECDQDHRPKEGHEDTRDVNAVHGIRHLEQR